MVNLNGNLINIARAGFLFALFGFICLIGNLIFIPIVLLNLQKYKTTKKYARFLVKNVWNFFIVCCEILDYQTSNRTLLKSLGKEGEIIISNHPSLLDIVFFIASIKNANCVVKGNLAKNIFLAPAIKASGYILNTSNEEFLQNAINALKNGETLVIFPEGTRSKDEIIFHKGAAYIAIKGAKILTPVFLNMSPRSLKKEQKWYNTPKIKIKYTFKIGETLDMQNFSANKPSPIRARLLHEKLKEIYKKEIAYD